jgi:hypothetical protein
MMVESDLELLSGGSAPADTDGSVPW